MEAKTPAHITTFTNSIDPPQDVDPDEADAFPSPNPGIRTHALTFSDTMKTSVTSPDQTQQRQRSSVINEGEEMEVWAYEVRSLPFFLT
jgi:hypothetical protein